MAETIEKRPRRGKSGGSLDATRPGQAQHPLDSEESRRLLRKLLEWFYFERDRQASNRLEMAIDHDFYDNIQWDPTDAQEVRDRGQMPLVFNEVAPMVDWIIGTERRTRVDWHVMPRTEDDVEMADVKRKTLKWLSDVNRVTFNRSRAFADAVKAGVGWIDDGVRDDPTTEPIYNRYEDWRNVLWDSMSYELDLSDARYLFRWRWVDEDIALAMYPDRKEAILRAIEDASFQSFGDLEEDTWYTLEEMLSGARNGTLRSSGQGMMIDAKRRRVKIYECQYREPALAKIVADGPFAGAFFTETDKSLSYAMAMAEMTTGDSATIVEKITMRVHMAIFTEGDLLRKTASPYRHNRFTLTPVWCYRRGRDRMPYGIIRRVRDIQQDLNKRASKALFMLNTNQVIAEEGAVADWDQAREEVDRPDGTIITKVGKKFEIRRDTDQATGQLQMMTLDAQSIQKSGGVSQENMGRQTNAVSGEAIKARQLQGSVVTTEPFDNLRLSTQISGEKQLSLAEQFLTGEKVLRITGAKGKIDWTKINVPEIQPDGSVRFVNDITATASDFIVSESDYAGTLRQVMFDSLNEIAGRLPPEVALKLLTIAYDFSDLPNKDEIADMIRGLTGERDPNKPMTPEEAQQQEQRMAEQAEMLRIQREQIMAALQEQQAKAQKAVAEAKKMEAEAVALMNGGDPAQAQAMQDAVMRVQQESDRIIQKLSEDLRKAQSELANRTIQIKADADAQANAERIRAEAQVRIAEIQKVSDTSIDRVLKAVDQVREATERRLADMELAQREARVRDQEQRAKEAAKAAEATTPAPAPAAAPAEAAAAPAAPTVVVVNGGQVEVGEGGEAAAAPAPEKPAKPVKRKVTVKRGAKGKLLGFQIEKDGVVQDVTIEDAKANETEGKKGGAE